MGFKVIPWQDFADFKQTIKLGDNLYTLRSRWNTVREFWTIDIYDNSGTALLLGQKLVFNTDVLERYQDSRLPAGRIFLINTSAEGVASDTVGRNDIGSNVFVIYEE